MVALALGGGLLALGLKPSAGIDTFVSASSPSYRATVDDERHFGDQAVIILIHESLPNLVETKDLATLTQLEACLAGQYVVAEQRRCTRSHRLRPDRTPPTADGAARAGS